MQASSVKRKNYMMKQCGVYFTRYAKLGGLEFKVIHFPFLASSYLLGSKYAALSYKEIRKQIFCELMDNSIPQRKNICITRKL